MTETTYHLPESQLDDGTIDFYTLLDESPDAGEEELRAKIQAIYGYASANRDHRNLNKRREFQALLELLPAARAALLEAPKRARYDAYLAAAKSGTADVDFETFINELLGNLPSEEEKTSLLGVQDKTAEPRARVIKAPAPPTASPTRAPAERRATPFFGAIAGFIAGIVIGLIFHLGMGALLVGIVLAALGYFALNSTSKNSVGR